MTNHGKSIWNELVTPDPKKCGEFYCKLIGWTKKEMVPVQGELILPFSKMKRTLLER